CPMANDLKKILVPCDGSAASEAVFPAILPLIRAYAPEVSVLHVFEYPDEEFLPPPAIENICETLRAADVDATLEFRDGQPAEEILKAAETTHADLIAMATHGRTGLVRLVAGSVAEQVLRRSSVPMLLTRPGTAVRGIRKIAVALDGSPR